MHHALHASSFARLRTKRDSHWHRVAYQTRKALKLEEDENMEMEEDEEE